MSASKKKTPAYIRNTDKIGLPRSGQLFPRGRCISIKKASAAAFCPARAPFTLNLYKCTLRHLSKRQLKQHIKKVNIMKILLINGSPKGERSDTMHMTRAFLRGMDSVAENEVKQIEVVSRRIEYCTGCYSCMYNGGSCVIDDDMSEILRDIQSSDLLLFSFPLYCYGVPAPLKALLDRTMPLSQMAMQKVGERYEHVSQADVSQLKYVMISGCGFPNARHNFEPLRQEFALMFRHDLFMLTVPEAPMFNAPEAKPVTEPFLKLVEQAGREYAQDGKVSAKLAESLAVPMIPEEVYAKICSGQK